MGSKLPFKLGPPPITQKRTSGTGAGRRGEGHSKSISALLEQYRDLHLSLLGVVHRPVELYGPPAPSTSGVG